MYLQHSIKDDTSNDGLIAVSLVEIRFSKPNFPLLKMWGVVIAEIANLNAVQLKGSTLQKVFERLVVCL